MNQKGFSAVAGIIIGLIILSAVVVGGVLILKNQEKPQENNTFELDKVKVGDTVGNMKITSIKPFAEQLIGKLKPATNVIIKFSGEATVSGRYGFDYELLGRNLLQLDNDSQKKLPVLKIDGSLTTSNKFICLDDPDSKIDYKKGGEGTFIVADFVLVSYPSEGCSSARVVKVLKTEPLPSNEVINIKSPVAAIDLDDAGKRWMLVRAVPNFEGELFSSVLYIIDAKNKSYKTIDNVSGALLLDAKTALISKLFSVEPGVERDDSNYAGEQQKLVSKVAKELGVSDKEVSSRIYGYGGKPVSAVNALFEIDMETGIQKSLKLFGGQGGIFRTQDKQIYISNDNTSSAYKLGARPNQGGGELFGSAPYMKYDPSSKNLMVTGLPDGFQVGFGKVFRPLVVSASKDAQYVSGGVGGVPIISQGGNLYVVFEWPYIRGF